MSRKKRKENCNKYRKSKGDEYLRVIQGGNTVVQRQRQSTVTITPRNFHQDDLLAHIEDDSVNIVFAIGPAGTGKTILSH